MRTYVYIDGFNLYYGSIRDTRYKWLDLMALSKAILPNTYQVNCVKYFTARVSGTPTDRNKHERQDAYLRALRAHIPEIEIYYGHFLRNHKYARLDPPITDHTARTHNSAQIINTEEKGSDVNLAVHLLNDAWHNRYDCAAIMSNDSDFAEALRLVKQERHKEIWVITPTRYKVSNQLKKYANQARKIFESKLKKCQLPSRIPSTKIHKPKEWS
jgi:uncharacterized LabA/DUF88 family protein